MENKLILATLLAVASVLALTEANPFKIAPIVQRMLDAFPVPNVPEGYVSTNANTVGDEFETRVDHFDPLNRAMFKFEYLSNDEFYQPGGPIFIFLGGNWPLTQYYIEHGHFHDIAKYENAWLFTNEHRYYGGSVPTEDLSAENLRFLSVEQAMVDVAEWIWHLRHNVVRDDNAKVILAGSGYAGAIGTWMRQRYPHLVDGVWVSSGQVEARLNFMEYAFEIGEVIREYGSDDCYSTIWRGFRTGENLIDSGLSSTISNVFNTCLPVNGDDTLDVESFFYNLKEAFQSAILQSPQTTESTEKLCHELGNSTGQTDLHVLAEWAVNRYYYLDCLPFDFATSIEVFRNIDKNVPQNRIVGLRQRMFQFCTEFGWFLTGDFPDQPFGYRVTINFFLGFCQSVYGDWLTGDVVEDGVHLTNLHFGGQNPHITKVLFTNGGLDPMRDISITDYHQSQANAIVIPGYFNSPDLNSISGYNSPQLIQAKHDIQMYIESWLWESVIPVQSD
ncbi:putative serine protease K12H4.7 [Malaya genurostris]|uniref:putative serine protease K12H4.7 n=1 Tax=Malaya genurostris TaxID=325434 RepID=UPI0026F3895D|nr:putative serine protease K12H4.7 [Malaya genurostris]